MKYAPVRPYFVAQQGDRSALEAELASIHAMLSGDNAKITFDEGVKLRSRANEITEILKRLDAEKAREEARQKASPPVSNEKALVLIADLRAGMAEVRELVRAHQDRVGEIRAGCERAGLVPQPRTDARVGFMPPKPYFAQN